MKGGVILADDLAPNTLLRGWVAADISCWRVLTRCTGAKPWLLEPAFQAALIFNLACASECIMGFFVGNTPFWEDSREL